MVSQDRYKHFADSCVVLFGDGKINFDKIKGLKMVSFFTWSG